MKRNEGARGGGASRQRGIEASRETAAEISCPHCRAVGVRNVPTYCSVRDEGSGTMTQYRKCRACGIGFKCVKHDGSVDVRIGM